MSSLYEMALRFAEVLGSGHGERSAQFLGLLLDAAVKATMVLLVAAFAVSALRRSSAAIRHRVWLLGLCGALLMPLLSLCLPQLRWAVLPARTNQAVASTNKSDVTDFNAHRSHDRAEVLLTDQTLDDQATRANMAERLLDKADQPTSFSTLAATPAPVPQTSKPDALRSESAASLTSLFRASVAVAWPWYVLVVWIIGLVVVLSPLAAGFCGNWWLLRRSRRIRSGRWTQFISELSRRVGLTRSVAAFESKQPVIPMTWGVLRPTVLLPLSWRDWPDERQRCVLLHELAHVKRFDVLFQLIGRLAVGTHWFNPLAWYALRQLRIERELACDDCVVASGERASDYARELLQIARLYRPRRLAVGVAMAKSARLDQRVIGILDQARSRLPVGRRLASCLLAVSSILVIGLSAISLVEKSAVLAAAPADQTSERTNPVSDDRQVTVSGVVLKPDGSPASGAKVYAMVVASGSGLGNSSVDLLAKSTAAADGTFSMKYQGKDLTDQRGVNQNSRQYRGVQFVATADQFAMGFSNYDQRRAYEAVEIQLAPIRSLSGRLIDLEGQPLAGVKIEVDRISQSADPLDEWFQQAAKNPRPDERAMSMASSDEPLLRPVRFEERSVFNVAGTDLVPVVETDSEGRFSIPGIGPGRLVQFYVTGATITRALVKMVSHPGPAVYEAYVDARVRDRMIHGADATITIEPGVAVQGKVVDAGSGEPIAGCLVEVGQIAGSLMAVEQFATTTTDESGHYLLDRLPPDPPNSRGYGIRFTPPASAPYFSTDAQVRITNGRQATLDIKLPRARGIRGRVVDADTGQPVRALVGYLPMLENKLAADYPNFNAGMRTLAYDDFRWNEPDGSFSVPAINGRGVLCVTAERMAAYAIAGQADQIDELQREGDRLGLYHVFGVAMCNEFREVNLTDSDPEPTIDVPLRPLSRRQVRIVDSDGQPVSDCHATGLMPDIVLAGRGADLLNHPPLWSAEADIVGLEFESPRGLAFHHWHRDLGAVVVARHEDDAAEPLTITLQPCGRIKGRLVDDSGNPLIGRSVHAQGLLDVELPKTKHHFQPATFQVYTETVHSDDQGRFELTHRVLPGIRYELTNADFRPPRERRLGEPIVAEAPKTVTAVVEPGQTIDVGDIVHPTKQHDND